MEIIPRIDPEKRLDLECMELRIRELEINARYGRVWLWVTFIGGNLLGALVSYLVTR